MSTIRYVVPAVLALCALLVRGAYAETAPPHGRTPAMPCGPNGVACPPVVSAGPVVVGNTIPRPASPNGALGDAWTFTCPKGGTFSASVDTFDDDGQENATLAPFLQIDDGDGNLVVAADHGVACTFPPVCGAQCPEVFDVPCGARNPHLLRIRSGHGDGCGGGGYRLQLEVRDKRGVVLTPAKIRLGGGAKRELPRWLDPNKSHQEGPALNDEYVF